MGVVPEGEWVALSIVQLCFTASDLGSGVIVCTSTIGATLGLVTTTTGHTLHASLTGAILNRTRKKCALNEVI